MNRNVVFPILVLSFLFASHFLFGITFERIYGRENADDWAEAVQQTEDGGYIVGGTTDAGSPYYWSTYPIKTDSAGDSIWSNSSSLYTGIIRAILQTTDGDFLAIAKNWIYNHMEFELIKYGSSGTRLWAKNFGGDADDEPYDFCTTADGNYLTVGITESYGVGGSDVWIVKHDTSVTVHWDTTVGGVDDDFGYAVARTSDHGFIITGGTYSFGAGLQDVYLIRIDSAGNLLWTKTYGGADDDVGMAVEQTTDGGFIIAGATHSSGTGYDVYLIRTNASGDTVWTRTFGGSAWDGAFSLCRSTDGAFVIVGETMSFGSGLADVYLLKVDDGGTLVWSKTHGDIDEDRGSAIAATDDGGYIIAGRTRRPSGIYYDIYLIKTDSQGNISIAEDLDRRLRTLKVYPNPSYGEVNLDLPDDVIEICLFDAAGRQIKRYKSAQRLKLKLPPGVYFLKIRTENQVRTEKIVVLK